MNSLSVNLDKLHATEAGAARIKRNLKLQTSDVVLWCKEFIRQSDIIFGLKKNWYVYGSGIAVTVNRQSYSIITAHKIHPKTRLMRETDAACLPEFLYQAVFVPEGMQPPSRDVVYHPDIYIYIQDFGTKPGDLGVVAEQNGQVIGAAWTRIIPAYGHIDDDTPELAVSILPEFRGYGVGTRLMHKLFSVLRDNGYTRTSLSVQKENPAVRFYERLGYRVTAEKAGHAGDEDFIMVKELD